MENDTATNVTNDDSLDDDLYNDTMTCMVNIVQVVRR